MKCLLLTLACLVLVSTASATKPAHLESPPQGLHPSVFAKEYQGCLGGLRSFLAREVGFTKDFNPGKHQGTVGEEEFLKHLLGLEDNAALAAFCASFD